MSKTLHFCTLSFQERDQLKRPERMLGLATVALLSATVAGPLAARGGFVALGASAAPDYEGSDHYTALPALFGRYNFAEGRYAALVGGADAARSGRLVLNLVPNSSWEMGPLLGVRYERNDPDNSRVRRMDDIDSAIEAGGFLSYRRGSWFSTLGLSWDVSDTYGGYIADLQAGYQQEMTDDLGLIYTASLSYADDEYMEEYFGVNARDAASSGLPPFRPDGGIKDLGVGISVNYNFTNTWGLIAGFDYYRLVGDAADSPLVDDEGNRNQFKGVVAVSYSF